MYTAGDNNEHHVQGENITVREGYFFEACDKSDMPNRYWEARPGEIFADIGPEGGPELIELTEWEPKQAYEVHFDLMDCGFTPPDINCLDFPEQTVGNPNPKINVNNGEVMEDDVQGACWPK